MFVHSRVVSLETVRLGTPTVAGPLNLYAGGTGLNVRWPIFLPNQTEDEVGGW